MSIYIKITFNILQFDPQNLSYELVPLNINISVTVQFIVEWNIYDSYLLQIIKKMTNVLIYKTLRPNPL